MGEWREYIGTEGQAHKNRADFTQTGVEVMSNDLIKSAREMCDLAMEVSETLRGIIAMIRPNECGQVEIDAGRSKLLEFALQKMSEDLEIKSDAVEGALLSVRACSKVVPIRARESTALTV